MLCELLPTQPDLFRPVVTVKLLTADLLFPLDLALSLYAKAVKQHVLDARALLLRVCGKGY